MKVHPSKLIPGIHNPVAIPAKRVSIETATCGTAQHSFCHCHVVVNREGPVPSAVRALLRAVVCSIEVAATCQCWARRVDAGGASYVSILSWSHAPHSHGVVKRG